MIDHGVENIELEVSRTKLEYNFYDKNQKFRSYQFLFQLFKKK